MRTSQLDSVKRIGPGIMKSGEMAFVPTPTPASLGLVIGTNIQAWDANLDQIAALSPTDHTHIVGNGTAWVATNVSGTDNAIARFDSTAGKLIQNSGVTIDDSNQMLSPSGVRSSGAFASNLASSGGVDFSAAGVRLLAWGADTSTLGVISFYQATSNGAGASGEKGRWSTSGNLLVGTTVDTASAGRVQLGTTSDTTAAGGVALGTDTQMFRGAANTLVIPDTLSIRAGTGALPAATTSQTFDFATTGNPVRGWVQASNTADGRIADTVLISNQLLFRFVNDAYSVSRNWLEVSGASGAVSLLASPTAVSNVLGHTATVTVGNAGKLQVAGATAAASQIQSSGYAADATTAGTIALSKSRHATVGSNTIVQNDDIVASVVGYGANGSTYTAAGNITVEINGTPGATTDMPGRLVGRATPDGSGTPLEVWRAVSVASAVNGFNFSNAATGNAPAFSVIGSDTDIDLALTPKGAGLVKFGAFTVIGVEVGAGTISIKDAAGNTRKLLVVA